jgi:hypothetical protein
MEAGAGGVSRGLLISFLPPVSQARQDGVSCAGRERLIPFEFALIHARIKKALDGSGSGLELSQ